MTGDAPETAADPLGEIELQLAMLLRFADGTHRASGAFGRLERSAYLILSILTERGPTSVNVLADSLILNASTITRQVDAMAAAGLVERSRPEEDRRVTLVIATDRGTEAYAANRQARHLLYDRVTRSWSDADRQCLANLLGRLNAALEPVVRTL